MYVYYGMYVCNVFMLRVMYVCMLRYIMLYLCVCMYVCMLCSVCVLVCLCMLCYVCMYSIYVRTHACLRGVFIYTYVGMGCTYVCTLSPDVYMCGMECMYVST